MIARKQREETDLGQALKSCPTCGAGDPLEAAACSSCGQPYGSGAPVQRKSSNLPMILLVVGAGVVGLIFLGSIIAAIVIPGMLAASRSSNERVALYRLKTLATAQEDFRANDRDGNQVNDYWVGDVSGLWRIVPLGADLAEPPEAKLELAIRLIEIPVAQADARPLDLATYIKAPWSGASPAPSGGYYYAALAKYEEGGVLRDFGTDTDGKTWYGPVHNLDRYAFVAYPAVPKSGGRFTYLITEAGVIWKKDTGGVPPPACPGHPAQAGWLKVD